MLYHAALFGLLPEEQWVIRFGWMGVDLFFVLSGYLIAGQLLRSIQAGSPDYGRFMARRLFRTIPAYAVVVLLYFAVPAIRERDPIQPLWQFLTFTQNFGIVPPKAFSHAWSLCVEEQFYVLAPLVLALLARRPNARNAWVAVAVLILGGIAVRAFTWLSAVAATPWVPAADPLGRPFMMWIYYPTWCRLDGLLAGVAVAAIQLYRPALWARLLARPNVLLFAGIVGVALASLVFGEQISGLAGAMLGYPLLAWSLALTVVAGTHERCWISRRELPIVGALAASAYSVYLTHKAVFGAVAKWNGGEPTLPAIALATVGAAVAGALLYALVERPFIRLRDRIVPTRR